PAARRGPAGHRGRPDRGALRDQPARRQGRGRGGRGGLAAGDDERAGRCAVHRRRDAYRHAGDAGDGVEGDRHREGGVIEAGRGGGRRGGAPAGRERPGGRPRRPPRGERIPPGRRGGGRGGGRPPPGGGGDGGGGAGAPAPPADQTIIQVPALPSVPVESAL